MFSFAIFALEQPGVQSWASSTCCIGRDGVGLLGGHPLPTHACHRPFLHSRQQEASLPQQILKI